jgi:predicted nucleic acid-binding protein
LAAVLLDTTVLIDVLRGLEAVERLKALRASGDTPHTCAVNIEELVRGLRPHQEPSAAGLIQGLRIVPLRELEGVRAGRWRREYARRGLTLSEADCLIAAAAVAVGGRLATGNPRDFPMPELTVEHWPAGE